MRPALKALGSVLAGFVLAGAVMMALEWLNGRVLYPELAKAAEGVTGQEAIQRIFAAAPLGSLLVVVAACGLGGLAGGWFTARLAPVQGPVWALAALLTLAGAVNNLMLPPPLWFWIATLLALPAGTLLGGRLAGPPR